MARITGIAGGIMGFILLMIADIPLSPDRSVILPLSIYSYNTTRYYLWGFIVNNNEVFSFSSLNFPENLLTLTFCLIIIYISIVSIIASLKQTNPNNSIKLYNLNIFLSFILLLLYTIQILMANLSNLILLLSKIGIGYYLLVLVLVLNSMAKGALKKEV